MDFLEIVILVLIVLYVSYIVLERFLLSWLRKKFKYVIHVNGIRGKSTTTRLIDAGLRECGFKVFSKTTGTIPTYINVNNEDVKVKRLGTANIREQIRMMYKAYKDGAECLVLECMAVNPELQMISEKMILKADLTVITNVREDHIMEMGRNKDELAEALSGTIPDHGKLVITDSEYAHYFKSKARGKNATIYVAEKYQEEDTLDTFRENIELALEVARALGLDADVFFNGMKKYHKDMGAYSELKKGKTILLNGLSINDSESINIVYDEIKKKYDPKDITVLLNNRPDRPTRVMQHIKLLSTIECKKVIITGSNKNYVIKECLKLNPSLDISYLKQKEDLLNEDIVFAIGNIKDDGMAILDYFKKGDD